MGQKPESDRDVRHSLKWAAVVLIAVAGVGVAVFAYFSGGDSSPSAPVVVPAGSRNGPGNTGMKGADGLVQTGGAGHLEREAPVQGRNRADERSQIQVQAAGVQSGTLAITVASTGTAFYTVSQNGSSLISGNVGQGSLVSLNDATGKLYGSDLAGNLISVNPTTGAKQVVTAASALCGGRGIDVSDTYLALPGNAVARGLSGKIVYLCSGATGSNSLVQSNMDGSGATTVVPASSGTLLYQLVSNGSTVAVLAHTGSDINVETVSLSGGSAVPLLPGHPNSIILGLGISASGAVYFADGAGIWQINVSNGNTTRLMQATAAADPGLLAVSPDGTQIAYSATNAVWVIPSSGGSASRVFLDGSGNTTAYVSSLYWE